MEGREIQMYFNFKSHRKMNQKQIVKKIYRKSRPLTEKDKSETSLADFTANEKTVKNQGIAGPILK
jgi:hypothetical protein